MLAQARTIYRTTAAGGRKTGKSHMAKDTTGTGEKAAADAKGNGEAPTLNVLAQYVKDLSFENPGAPKSLGPREKAPAININVNVNANPLSETEFDVVLTMNAEAKNGETVVFNAELVYGGVFRVANFPQEHMLPLLFIECPRILFPFARQIIADATRNGGFPPLLIDPIDFAQMFQQRMAEEKTKSQVANQVN
jgi:preprotein translocase subunit SecB